MKLKNMVIVIANLFKKIFFSLFYMEHKTVR